MMRMMMMMMYPFKFIHLYRLLFLLVRMPSLWYWKRWTTALIYGCLSTEEEMIHTLRSGKCLETNIECIRILEWAWYGAA